MVQSCCKFGAFSPSVRVWLGLWSPRSTSCRSQQQPLGIQTRASDWCQGWNPVLVSLQQQQHRVFSWAEAWQQSTRAAFLCWESQLRAQALTVCGESRLRVGSAPPGSAQLWPRSSGTLIPAMIFVLSLLFVGANSSTNSCYWFVWVPSSMAPWEGDLFSLSLIQRFQLSH